MSMIPKETWPELLLVFGEWSPMLAAFFKEAVISNEPQW